MIRAAPAQRQTDDPACPQADPPSHASASRRDDPDQQRRPGRPAVPHRVFAQSSHSRGYADGPLQTRASTNAGPAPEPTRALLVAITGHDAGAGADEGG